MMLEMFPEYVNKANRRFSLMNDYDTDEKIVIFGDSYAHSGGEFLNPVREKQYFDKSWFGHLHHKTKKQIWNWGCGGTSLLYSKQNLFGYLNNEDYDKDDYIIFIATSHNRIPTFPNDSKYKSHWQSMLLGFFENRISKKDESYKMFIENKKVMEWFSYTLFTEDFINELRMLQVFLNSLPNKTLLLPAFKYNDANKFLDIKEFCLCDVTVNEKKHKWLFVDKENPAQMRFDTRKQHMSDTNNEILADMIINHYKGISSFKLEDFKK